MVSKKATFAYRLLESRIQVLLDAFTIEDVSALSLDCVFGYIIAEPTDCSLSHILGKECPCIRLATEDEIRVTSHLTHSCQPIHE